jgi:hypothetical protein
MLFLEYAFITVRLQRFIFKHSRPPNPGLFHHRRIHSRQLLDRQILRFTVFQAHLGVATEQCVFDFLLVIDALIALGNAGLKLARCNVVVLADGDFKIFEVLSKVRAFHAPL